MMSSEVRFLSAAVLYVGGRAVAQTEHVRVHVFVVHAAGSPQDADRCRTATGQQ